MLLMCPVHSNTHTHMHTRACRHSPCVSALFCLCARWPQAWLCVWEPGTADEIITASFISHHLTSDLPSAQLNAIHKTSAVPHSHPSTHALAHANNSRPAPQKRLLHYCDFIFLLYFSSFHISSCTALFQNIKTLPKLTPQHQKKKLKINFGRPFHPERPHNQS